jgi:NADH:ubiquinone oxidoreductase subunit 6 (subunit J)
VAAVMARAVVHTTWQTKSPAVAEPTTYAIGNGLLNEFALPFELASVVLLVSLIGAVVLSRKELRE